MFKRKVIKESYDKDNQIPVIRASICTGEQVAGFKDLSTGRFTESMLIRNHSDLNDFLEKYGVEESEIKKEW